MNNQQQRCAVAIAYIRCFADPHDQVVVESLGGVTQIVARARPHRRKQSVAILAPIRGDVWTATVIKRDQVTVKQAHSASVALELACLAYEASRAEQVAP